MKELLEIFKMEELSKEVRINLLIKAGQLINAQYCANLTEPVVYEFLKILDPNHPYLKEMENRGYFIKK